jgi:transcription antitermination factor NusG
MYGLDDYPSWYAVRTRSNFERRAADEVSAKGIETYLPAFREVSRWTDRKKVIERPLFAGYLFARFVDSGPARLSVLKTPGVVRILGTGGSIEAVPQGEIEAIRKMLSANISCFAHPFLREGNRVRIRNGALKGVEGLLVRFKNQHRLVLSVELLCQSVAMEVDIRDVEPVSVRGGERRIA